MNFRIIKISLDLSGSGIILENAVVNNLLAGCGLYSEIAQRIFSHEQTRKDTKN
jgi:hypothetical protein